MSKQQPLKLFEKWLYPSMLLWLAAFSWLVLRVVPSHPFTTPFDAVVGALLTAAATFTAAAALILSRRS